MGKRAYDSSVSDRSNSIFQSSHKEFAHRTILRQILRFAFIEVDAKDEGVEFVSGNTEPDGESVSIQGTIDSRDCSEGKGSDDLNLRDLTGQLRLQAYVFETTHLPRTLYFDRSFWKRFFALFARLFVESENDEDCRS